MTKFHLNHWISRPQNGFITCVLTRTHRTGVTSSNCRDTNTKSKLNEAARRSSCCLWSVDSLLSVCHGVQVAHAHLPSACLARRKCCGCHGHTELERLPAQVAAEDPRLVSALAFSSCFCRAAVASDLHPLSVCCWRWWWCKSRSKRDLSTLTSVPPDAQRALTLQSASLWVWSSSAAGGRSAGCARVAPPITSCQMFNKTWTILNGVLQTVSAPVCRVGTLQ